MTLNEAAETWERCKRIREDIDGPMEAAAEVLKEHFRKSGKNKRGRIAYALSTFRWLNTKAVRAHLGDEVSKFEERRERETLSLLS